MNTEETDPKLENSVKKLLEIYTEEHRRGTPQTWVGRGSEKYQEALKNKQIVCLNSKRC